MGFQITKESYAGSIKEISIGKGDKAVKVGGETCYPFCLFEGDMPNKPKIAMEVWDMEPEDWPEWAKAPFSDVLSDPAAWAKKCVDEFGADMIALQLKSTDPNTSNASAADAVATVKKVIAAVDVPLILWGTTNVDKDEAVLKKIAEECQDVQLTLGPVEEKNHKGIGAAAMAYGHAVISSSPIDVNLAKQVNILLENLGMPMDRILVDPTTGGLGYGLEYTYSVMERLRLAAMAQGDNKLQFPMVNNLGNEVWKSKEAKQPFDENPLLGDPERRAILMEAVGAVTYLMAGSDLLIIRHPEAARMVRSFIDTLVDGGTLDGVNGISKLLDEQKADYASLAPKPDLTIEEEKAPARKAAAKKAAPAAKKAAPAAQKAAPRKAAEKPAAEPEKAASAEAPKAAAADDAADKAVTEAAAKAKAQEQAEAKAKAKAKADADADADAEVKAKADADAKARADAEARKKAEAEARAKREEEENALRLKRAEERRKMEAKREPTSKSTISVTPLSDKKSDLEKLVDRLDKIHQR